MIFLVGMPIFEGNGSGKTKMNIMQNFTNFFLRNFPKITAEIKYNYIEVPSKFSKNVYIWNIMFMQLFSKIVFQNFLERGHFSNPMSPQCRSGVIRRNCTPFVLIVHTMMFQNLYHFLSFEGISHPLIAPQGSETPRSNCTLFVHNCTLRSVNLYRSLFTIISKTNFGGNI